MASGKTAQPLLRTSIDRSSPVPYYAQVREAIQEAIESGHWRPGDQIPGEPELCDLFDVSRTVIRQALQDLEYQGLIKRVKGVGTFVTEPKIGEGLVQKLTGFYQDMTERGYAVLTQVLKQEVIPAKPTIADYLKIEPGSRVIEIERLRFVQGEPIVLVTTYLPYALCPDVAVADFSHQSLYAFLEERYGLVIAYGHRTLEAVLVGQSEADLLEVNQSAPMMRLKSVSYLADGTPVEYYHAYHRGDRSRFEVELVRLSEEVNLAKALKTTSDGASF